MDLVCPARPKQYDSMRELSHDTQDTPTLFDAPPPEAVSRARDFVKWCCSFGTSFRNSPDVTNLRYWAQQNKVKIKDRDEAEILQAARAAFLKRIEQQVRSALAREAEPIN